jgi:hypothetical protein
VWVIRRLVTKGYIQMDGEQMYRLTDDGQQAVSDLMEVDATAGSAPAREGRSATTLEQVIRRLVLVTPQELKSGQATDVYVGFHPAAPVDYLDESAEMVVRLSLVNAEPTRPQEAALDLSNDAAYSKFTITAGTSSQSRLRIQAFQLGPNPDDIAVAGGFHVDVNVLASGNSADPALVAYAADVAINKT